MDNPLLKGGFEDQPVEPFSPSLHEPRPRQRLGPVPDCHQRQHQRSGVQDLVCPHQAGEARWQCAHDSSAFAILVRVAGGALRLFVAQDCAQRARRGRSFGIQHHHGARPRRGLQQPLHGQRPHHRSARHSECGGVHADCGRARPHQEPLCDSRIAQAEH